MAGKALASTLADVFRLVEVVFGLLKDGTPLMFGAQYRDEPGPGSALRVVFVPDDAGSFGPGSFGPAQKVSAGYSASWSHGCTVAVRGVEPGDDPRRFEPAYLLAARVADILKQLDPAHIVLAPGNPRDTSPLPVEGPSGAEITFAFTYTTNIPTDPAVLRAIAQIRSVSPPDPDRPGGDTGHTFVVNATPIATP